MNPLTNTFYAGLFLLIAGLCGLVRHFLLEPNVPNYPRAPQWLLHVFFAFATVLIFLGGRFLTAWASGAAVTTPPGATPSGALLALVLVVYKGSLLVNVLMQRYPADTWKRLNRIQELARCSGRKG